MGLGLAALNRFAGAAVIDRLGLRKPAERAVYEASKVGFRTAGAASRTLRGGAASAAQPGRLTPAADDGLFDLTPTDEQTDDRRGDRREFAAEQLRPAAAGGRRRRARRPRPC